MMNIFFVLSNPKREFSFFPLGVLVYTMGGANCCQQSILRFIFFANLVKEQEGPSIHGRILWLAIWIVDNLFEESSPIQHS
jgi:hypothetical protein